MSLVCITGAAGGLGKAFAVECASRGWDLFLTDLSGEHLADLASGLSRAFGVSVEYHPCDLTDPEARAALFEEFRRRGRRFWSLINVAGLDYEGLFLERAREEIRRIVRLNVEAVLEMTHAILALRDEGRPFRLINVASLAAYYPMPVKATYAASKRFLLDFSLALREELRRVGGSVTVLCPAGLPTREEAIRAIEAQGLMGRLTTTDVGFVAARTIDSALRGRPVYVPGAVNRMLRFLGGLAPPGFAASFIGERWHETHRRVRTAAT
ncbi:MAG: SDR family NAD(P)-dependent oxidoreductase [Firmicutes bacterium]|nr:SDR family NAD(P)-dependent oxidoreductase [Bacillota bacterium]